MVNLLEKEQLTKVETKIPWTQKTIYKPVIILVVTFLLQQLAGVYLIIFYVVNILEQMHVLTVAKTSDDLRKSNQYILVFGLLRFISSIISAIVCRYYGRKPILIVSYAGMAVSLLAALYFIEMEPNTELTFLSMSGFLVFSSFGASGIPWTLASELLSTEVRGKICGYLFSAAYVFMFATVKVFPFVLLHVNIMWILVFFIVVAIIKVVFVCIYVPETFRKNIDDILNSFN